jgi:hypothetical protein
MPATPVPEPVSYLPLPEHTLELPVNRRTISAGRNISAAITQDGSMWVWGGFRVPDIWTYINTVMRGVGNGTHFIFREDGTPFIPGGSTMYDGTDLLINCNDNPNRHYNINDLRIEDEAGNPFTRADMHTEEDLLFLLRPRHFADKAAAVHADSMYFILDGDGTFYFNGERQAENVADITAAQSNMAYKGLNWETFPQAPPIAHIHYGVIQADGTFYLVTQEGSVRRPFEAAITAMDFGMEHMLFLAYDGQLFARGSGSAVGVLNQEGVAPPAWVMDNVAQIAAGRQHSMAVTKDGRLYAWGRNARGQLGTGNRQNEFLPAFIMDDVIALAAGDEHSMAITADGSLWGWGCNQHGQVGVAGSAMYNTPVRIMENIVAVTAGHGHTMALTADGTLLAWGLNTSGQLGDGTRQNRSEPVIIMTEVMLP